MVHPLHSLPSTPAATPSRPADAPAPAEVTVSYNSQDEVVFGATPTAIANVTTEGGLATEKTRLNADLAPNAEGAYVYDSSDPDSLTAAISFASTAKTIEAFSKAVGEPVNWAFGKPQLQINADAGEDFNAYYAREEEAVSFFHGLDPVTNETVRSGASGEVVSHEIGHALLDAFRPGYFSSWTPDVGAYHESFGDMVAMLMTLQDDNATRLAAQQTNGDLKQPNCIAALGEHLGAAINHVVGENATGGDYVRNAINDFKWADPNELPWSAPPDQLSSEVHSYSRLWTGAFYDVLAGLQTANMATSTDVEGALKATGEQGMRLLANSLKEAPQGDFTFRDMANAWIEADRVHNNGENVELLTSVFTNRGIIGDSKAVAASPASSASAALEPLEGSDEQLGASPFKSVTTFTGEGRKALSECTRPVYVQLRGTQFGLFQGAKVETLVDKQGALTKDAEIGKRVRNNVARYISEGRIRYNEPNYRMKMPQDLFDAKGRPYIGFVRWENGEMVIERAKVAN